MKAETVIPSFNEAAHKEDLGFVDYEVFTEQLEKAGKAVEPKVDGRAQEVYLPTKQKNGSWTLEDDSAFAAYAKNANTPIVYYDKNDGAKKPIDLSVTKNKSAC